jgi:hypothetical protein
VKVKLWPGIVLYSPGPIFRPQARAVILKHSNQPATKLIPSKNYSNSPYPGKYDLANPCQQCSLLVSVTAAVADPNRFRDRPANVLYERTL